MAVLGAYQRPIDGKREQISSVGQTNRRAGSLASRAPSFKLAACLSPGALQQLSSIKLACQVLVVILGAFARSLVCLAATLAYRAVQPAVVALFDAAAGATELAGSDARRDAFQAVQGAQDEQARDVSALGGAWGAEPGRMRLRLRPLFAGLLRTLSG